jgi:hypothetical protein
MPKLITKKGQNSFSKKGLSCYDYRVAYKRYVAAKGIILVSLKSQL